MTDTTIEKNSKANTVAPVAELPRMAFTLRETAQMIGVSYITAVRLIQRGLLKPNTALRTKLIAKTEIERFLANTTK
jgi:hypothetical protein